MHVTEGMMVSHHMWLEDNFQEIFEFPSSGEFCQSSGLHSKSSYPLSHLSSHKGWTPKVGVTPKSAAGTEPGEPQSCCLCEIYLGGLFRTPGFCAVLLLPHDFDFLVLYSRVFSTVSPLPDCWQFHDSYIPYSQGIGHFSYTFFLNRIILQVYF